MRTGWKIVFILLIISLVAGIFIGCANKNDEKNNDKNNEEQSQMSNENNIPQVEQVLKGKKILIDPGHGGIDAGTIGKTTGVLEKDIAMEMSYSLKEKFEALGATVYLTMTSEISKAKEEANEKFTFSERGKVIKDANADLMLSLHCNYSEDAPNAHGCQILYYRDEFSKYAESLQNDLNTLWGTENHSHRDNYYILKYGDELSFLVETGFLSNKEDELGLQTVAYQNKILDVIVDWSTKYLTNNLVLESN